MALSRLPAAMQQTMRLLGAEPADLAIRQAAMLGVQRPSLNKILKEFERRGLIEVRYAAINIRDHPGLLAVAG